MVQTADVAQREKLFTMRMNDEEHARLNDLASHYGLTVAGVLRMLVKAKHDEVIRPGVALRDEAIRMAREMVEGTTAADKAMRSIRKAVAKKSAPKK